MEDEQVCPKCRKPIWGEGWNPETGVRYFSHCDSGDAANCEDSIEIQGVPRSVSKPVGESHAK
jgi:hypothetical protein